MHVELCFEGYAPTVVGQPVITFMRGLLLPFAICAWKCILADFVSSGSNINAANCQNTRQILVKELAKNKHSAKVNVCQIFKFSFASPVTCEVNE